MSRPEDDLRREAERIREEAQRARDDAQRARDEAKRARDEANRLRREARDLARGARHESRHPGRGPQGPWGPQPPPGPVPPFPFGMKDGGDEPGGKTAEETFSLDGIRNIAIDQTAGKLTVRLCAEGETPGVVSGGGQAEPKLEVRREGDKLVIEVKLQKSWIFRRRQGATTVVRLAGELPPVRVDLGYGELQVRDIDCESLKLEVGAGTIACYSVRSDVDANMGAGKVSFHDHAGRVDCDTGTGDVLVDIAEAPPGEYRVDVGMGKGEVRMPAGLEVFVKASSGIGKSRVEYPAGGEGSPIKLKLNTGIGEVSVRPRDDSRPPARPPAQAKPQRGMRGAQPIRRFEAEELRVLQMLEQGQISSQDAADLIAALRGTSSPTLEENGDAAEDEPSPGPFS